MTDLGTATCDMECSGDGTQICGDFDAISLYEYSDTSPTPVPPTPEPPPKPTEDEYISLGCFGDVGGSRVFRASASESSSMTTEVGRLVAAAAFLNEDRHIGLKRSVSNGAFDFGVRVM